MWQRTLLLSHPLCLPPWQGENHSVMQELACKRSRAVSKGVIACRQARAILFGEGATCRRRVWLRLAGGCAINAAMAFQRLIQTHHLYDGFRQVMRVGRHELLILQHDGDVHVLDNRCPHQGFPMDRGSIQGQRLVCPRHGFAFHLRNGDCLQANSCRLEVFRVEYQGSWLGVEL